MKDDLTCLIVGLDENTTQTVRELCSAAEIAFEVFRSGVNSAKRLMHASRCCCLVDMRHADSLATFMHREIAWIPAIGIDFCTAKQSSRQVLAKATSFGLCDYLVMPEEREQLGQAISAALALDSLGSFSPRELRRRCSLLTAREKEVIHLFLQGDNTKVNAKSLGITYQTVDKHRGRALRKLGVQSVAELSRHIHLTCLTSMGSRLPEHFVPDAIPKPHVNINPAAIPSQPIATNFSSSESYHHYHH